MAERRVSRASGAPLTLLSTCAAVLALCLPSAVSVPAILTANTLLVMGGNRNPSAVTPLMSQELGGDPWYPQPNRNPLTPVGVLGGGYLDTVHNPASPYTGWDFTPVTWPAEIWLPVFGLLSYGESQRQGLASFDAALAGVLPTLAEGERVTAVGYSSSANVMVRAMRALEQRGAPSADSVDFLLLGSPNRPNGGILQRFAGLHVPLLDVDFDGSTPVDTSYPTVDISWEYDPASDFPTYPLNLLAVLNSLVGGSMLHGNYFRADINGQRAFPDSTVGNVTYITLEPPHLPLLLPLYDVGVPAPLLDLVEPALTVMVDWGYDRSIGPGTPATAQLLPRIDPLTAVTELAGAVAEGVRNATQGGESGPSVGPASITARGARVQPCAAAPPERANLTRGRGATVSVDRKADRHEGYGRADRHRR